MARKKSFDPLVYIPNFIRIERAERQGRLREYIRGSSSGYIKRPELREYVFSRDSYKCKTCGTDNNLQIDHIKSVCVIGLEANHIDNLQTLCRSCNARKWA